MVPKTFPIPLSTPQVHILCNSLALIMGKPSDMIATLYGEGERLQRPKSVDFKLTKREIILGGPDLIR